MILCVGPLGSGKSSLLKALQKRGVPPVTSSTSAAATAAADLKANQAIDTIPTCGTNLVEVLRPRMKKNKQLPPDIVTIREVGGALAPLWHSYIEPARTRALLYVVDASAPETLGAATLHLVELLSQPGMEGAPALVVFSKTDVKPKALTLRERPGVEEATFSIKEKTDRGKKVYDWCIKFAVPKAQPVMM